MSSSSTSWCEYCIPITNNTCDVADDYCSGSPNSGARQEGACCGPRGEPCCIDCYYCLTPCTLVLDIVCFPCNMYYNLCKKNEVNEVNNAMAI